MFSRLVQKELTGYLLDFRFIAVLGISVLLSVLSVCVGIRSYARQVEQHRAVSESNRSFISQSLKKGQENLSQAVMDLVRVGVLYNRRPETLSPVVLGLAASLGREAHLQPQRVFLFEDSPFSVDPVNALFEALDFAFVVKIILSLCVLLLTFDAVCGEKEAGTLRLYASFPVPRSAVALAKLVGSSLAVLTPFVVSFLLVACILALHPDVDMKGQDWWRMAGLGLVFGLYLKALAAWGLFMSSLAQRRMTAFLALMGVWVCWIFILPNIGLRIAQTLSPVESYYAMEKQANEVRWESLHGITADGDAFSRQFMGMNRSGLSQAQQEEFSRRWREEARKIQEKWDDYLYARLSDLQAGRHNQMHRQQALTSVASALSPLGAVSFLSMDLARTGPLQHERMEDALITYLTYLSRFVREKGGQPRPDLSDFVWFTYQDPDTLGTCLSRNIFNILNLALLAILGFAGAYVAILRYDVR